MVMLWFPVLVAMVGILAGAIAREIAAEPQAMNDIGAWVFGLGGAVLGGFVGLLVAGWDPAETSDQWWSLVLSLVGAAAAVGAFVALSGAQQHAVEANSDTRQRTTPVSGSREPETGAHGS